VAKRYRYKKRTPRTTVLTLTLFGETKTARKWAEDQRCQVSYSVILARSHNGWDLNRESILKYSLGHSGFNDRFTAVLNNGEQFGPFQTIRDAEQLILQMSNAGRIIDRTSNREVQIPREPTDETNPHRAPVLLTAWGETKSVMEWAKDERCVVGLQTIYHRLRSKKGWNPEDAISEPARQNVMSNLLRSTGAIYHGFGESKTVDEWLKDPRCEIGEAMLRLRLKAGEPIDSAIKRRKAKSMDRTRIQGLLFEGFGEQKTFREWLADPRCEVQSGWLQLCLKKGVPIEKAIKKARHLKKHQS
jgi:hypothetical protein